MNKPKMIIFDYSHTLCSEQVQHSITKNTAEWKRVYLQAVAVFQYSQQYFLF